MSNIDGKAQFYNINHIGNEYFGKSDCKNRPNTCRYLMVRVFSRQYVEKRPITYFQPAEKRKTGESYGTPVFQSFIPGRIFGARRRLFARCQMMGC